MKGSHKKENCYSTITLSQEPLRHKGFVVYIWLSIFYPSPYTTHRRSPSIPQRLTYKPQDPTTSKFFLHSAMAKEFLARILTIENSVKSNGGQDCIICQEKCGTLSPDTGIMELEVRLPCNHTIGSAVSHPFLILLRSQLLTPRFLVHSKLARRE